MKQTGAPDSSPADTEALLPEYRFDYSKARPNRFARPQKPGSRTVVPEPDVAEVSQAAADLKTRRPRSHD